MGDRVRVYDDFDIQLMRAYIFQHFLFCCFLRENRESKNLRNSLSFEERGKNVSIRFGCLFTHFFIHDVMQSSHATYQKKYDFQGYPNSLKCT